MADIYYTENSAYVIDEEGNRYKRTARKAQPVESHRLTYDEWHPLKSAVVEDGCLRIHREDSVEGIITTPIEFVVVKVDPEYPA